MKNCKYCGEYYHPVEAVFAKSMGYCGHKCLKEDLDHSGFIEEYNEVLLFALNKVSYLLTASIKMNEDTLWRGWCEIKYKRKYR